jgi:Zn-finger nucleic acid-binding protein
MRPYERSRIQVEQCEDCRGIFLDQGELERLVEAEGGGWSGRIVQPSGSADDHEVEPRNAR